MNLMLGDCLERMKEIPDKSVDMVLCDPPYMCTGLKWDSIIPFDKMWSELRRVVRDRQSAVVLFGNEPFSSHLRTSNPKEFKYDWYWKKTMPTGHLMAKKRPMMIFEVASVFCGSGFPRYFPQGLKPYGKIVSNPDKRNNSAFDSSNKARLKSVQEFTNYPKNILEYGKDGILHPSQKPTNMLEYLIKTYTLPGETVLDFTMGSGSTGVAAKNLDRGFIGIERDPTYFEIAKKRIESAQISIDSSKEDDSQLEFPA